MTDIDADTILTWFKEQVKDKNKGHALDPELWLDAVEKLAVLLGDEEAKLYDLQQKVAEKKLELYNQLEKPTVSKAEMEVEATDLYKEYSKQKAKINQIEEFIRLAKLRVKVAGGL